MLRGFSHSKFCFGHNSSLVVSLFRCLGCEHLVGSTERRWWYSRWSCRGRLLWSHKRTLTMVFYRRPWFWSGGVWRLNRCGSGQTGRVEAFQAWWRHGWCNRTGWRAGRKMETIAALQTKAEKALYLAPWLSSTLLVYVARRSAKRGCCFSTQERPTTW